MKIATAQYQLDMLANFSEYAEKSEALIQKTEKEGTQLLLLPEYAGLELAFATYDTDEEEFAAIQSSLPAYLDLFKRLAQKYNIYLQPGTIPVNIQGNTYANRAYFFSPTGVIGFQDKLQLTQYEKESNILIQGTSQTLFETTFGKIGIAICYDSEFPEIVRRLVFAGAHLILVPSYTRTLAGYYRVSLSSRARAIENQCYVATSYLIGPVISGGATDMTLGHAAIFGPADASFPDDGILAQNNSNQPALAFADLSFEKLKIVRRKGHVHNFEDGMNQLLLGDPACLTC